MCGRKAARASPSIPAGNLLATLNPSASATRAPTTPSKFSAVAKTSAGVAWGGGTVALVAAVSFIEGACPPETFALGAASTAAGRPDTGTAVLAAAAPTAIEDSA